MFKGCIFSIRCEIEAQPFEKNMFFKNMSFLFLHFFISLLEEMSLVFFKSIFNIAWMT